MQNNHLKEIYIYSPWLRIFHWVMVLSIIILFFTGLYITKPIGTMGLEPTFVDGRFSLQTIREIHFITSFIFVASFILRIYGYATNKGDRLFPRLFTKEHWQGMMEVKMHYMFLKPHHKPYLRNPLARMSYVGAYTLIILEAITGFAMYFMINPNGFGAKLFGPVIYLLGDEYNVHLVHHYIAWLIVLFAIVHVYMAVRADFMEREGEISSMFSGVKFFAHEPVDLGEIMEKPKAAQGSKQAGGVSHV